MDDILITVIAWMIAASMFVGVLGGWLLFVVAWLNDYFTTRPIPRWMRRTQPMSNTRGAAHTDPAFTAPVLRAE